MEKNIATGKSLLQSDVTFSFLLLPFSLGVFPLDFDGTVIYSRQRNGKFFRRI
jgi:hypothetical protein